MDCVRTEMMDQLDGACKIGRRSHDGFHLETVRSGHLLTLITQKIGPFYEFTCTGCDWTLSVTALEASAEPLLEAAIEKES